MKKKALIFCRGNSNDVNTWSNVPYFLSKEIEKEYETIRVNTRLEDRNLFYKFYSKLFNFISRRTRSFVYSFDRTNYYNKRVNKIIKKSIEKHKDATFALAFDLSSDLSNEYGMKSILLSDWTVKYLLQHHLNMKVRKIEQKLIDYENSVIKKADYRITLFPNVEKENKDLNLKYLLFPLNTDLQFDINPETKYKENRILFCGRKAYLKALEQLIEAVKIVNEKLSDSDKYQIDIIGLDKKYVKSAPSYCNFHGYLSKNNTEELKIYKECFEHAKFAVYSSENWVGASSLIECLSAGIPIILKTNPDAELLFTHEGIFTLDDTSSKGISDAILKVHNVDFEKYSKMVSGLSKDYSKMTWAEFYHLLKEYCSL